MRPSERVRDLEELYRHSIRFYLVCIFTEFFITLFILGTLVVNMHSLGSSWSWLLFGVLGGLSFMMVIAIYDDFCSLRKIKADYAIQVLQDIIES